MHWVPRCVRDAAAGLATESGVEAVQKGVKLSRQNRARQKILQEATWGNS
jgi:hypothetical protein